MIKQAYQPQTKFMSELHLPPLRIFKTYVTPLPFLLCSEILLPEAHALHFPSL